MKLYIGREYLPFYNPEHSRLPNNAPKDIPYESRYFLLDFRSETGCMGSHTFWGGISTLIKDNDSYALYDMNVEFIAGFINTAVKSMPYDEDNARVSVGLRDGVSWYMTFEDVEYARFVAPSLMA